MPAALSETLQPGAELTGQACFGGLTRQPLRWPLNGNQLKGFRYTIAQSQTQEELDAEAEHPSPDQRVRDRLLCPHRAHKPVKHTRICNTVARVYM